MTSLRRNLGPVILLIAALSVCALVALGISGYTFPRWLLDLTLLF